MRRRALLRAASSATRRRRVRTLCAAAAPPSVNVVDISSWTTGATTATDAERQRAAPGPRGLGVELRIYSVNPGQVEARARAAGHTVLQPTATKPHGLVECYLQGPGGYVWVPSCPTKEEPEPEAEEDKGG